MNKTEKEGETKREQERGRQRAAKERSGVPWGCAFTGHTWPQQVYTVARHLYWLVLCVNLTQARVITEKGACLEEVPP